MKRLPILIAALCAATSQATPPCRPDSAFANPQRSGQQWAAAVQWVAVGRVVALKHDLQPFANCGLADRSACTQFNHARLTLKVERMEKGRAPASGKLELEPHYCGKEIAPNFDTTRRYRFFGNGEGFFETFETIEP